MKLAAGELYSRKGGMVMDIYFVLLALFEAVCWATGVCGRPSHRRTNTGSWNGLHDATPPVAGVLPILVSDSLEESSILTVDLHVSQWTRRLEGVLEEAWVREYQRHIPAHAPATLLTFTLAPLHVSTCGSQDANGTGQQASVVRPNHRRYYKPSSHSQAITNHSVLAHQ